MLTIRSFRPLVILSMLGIANPLMPAIASRFTSTGQPHPSSAMADADHPRGIMAIGDWFPVGTSDPPAPRREHRAIYDENNDRMIVFGGEGSPSSGDTWILDFATNQWSQLTIPYAPSHRRDVATIFDPLRRRMILFGGDDGNSFLNDLWALSLDGNPAWEELHPHGSAPPPRMWGLAVYDPVNDRMILFGGYPQLNDTWSLSLTNLTWTQLAPAGPSPGGRWGHTGIYDSVNQQLVVFGGWSIDTQFNDVWALSLSGNPSWTQLVPGGSQPPPLLGAAAAFDPQKATMFVYGGLSPIGNVTDTYELSLQGAPMWALLTPPHGTPPPRRFHSAVYRTPLSQMVVFGGFGDGENFFNDTWALDLGSFTGPFIGGFSPRGGRIGDPVSIQGFNLGSTIRVSFDGVDAAFVVQSSIQVDTTVPLGATTGPIILETPQGIAVSNQSFFVGETPEITAAIPDSGKIGAHVSVRGRHFTTAQRVSFGGANYAAFALMSDSLIDAVVDSAAFTGPISVTTLAATGSSAFSFRFIPPDPRPRLRAVRDVPLDQGGRVVLEWEASDFDIPSNATITGYRVWRRAPSHSTMSRGTASEPLANGSTADQVSDIPGFWESLAEIPAAFLSGYAYTAATPYDSSAAGNPLTAFFVQALTADRTVFYISNADSGYSVDNLAPRAPSPFVAALEGVGVALHWGQNREIDLAEYRLYRGTNRDFVPGPSNRIAARADTGYFDPDGRAGSYYKLAAVDIHGNESLYAAISPGGPTSVDSHPVALALRGVHPNPVSGSRLWVDLELPDSSPARLELIDVTGRVIVSHDLSGLGPGDHRAQLRGDRNSAPGIHFIRLTQGGKSLTQKVVVLQ